MKYRKWSPQDKARIVLEGLQNNGSLAELCNKYQISQGLYHYWVRELNARAAEVFRPKSNTTRENKLKDENRKLKRIIGELTVELKKTELKLNGEEL